MKHTEVNWDLISNTQCSCYVTSKGNGCTSDSCPCLNIPCLAGSLEECGVCDDDEQAMVDACDVCYSIKIDGWDIREECDCVYRGCNEDCNCSEDCKEMGSIMYSCKKEIRKQ